jgi:hypothetical protein
MLQIAKTIIYLFFKTCSNKFDACQFLRKLLLKAEAGTPPTPAINILNVVT